MSHVAPLHGVRVVDLTRHLPGPYCTLLLGDLGARIVKVEDPRGGDPTRHLPPFDDDGSSLTFAALNRGKRSVALDLKSAAGREAFERLVGWADVLVEGFRPGVLERLGFGIQRLWELQPRLVVCAITGYGQSGARARRAGHDLNYLAACGALSLCRTPDDRIAPPGFQAADVVGGALMAALRITAALRVVQTSGRGAFLDVSMAEGASALWVLSAGAAVAGVESLGQGDGLLSGRRACYAVYETADGGHVSLAALEPKFWAAFCHAVGHPEWVARQMLPGEEAAALHAEVAALFRSKPLAHWAELAERVDCCLEPVASPREALRGDVLGRGAPPLPEGPAAAAHLRTPVLPPGERPARTHVPALGEHTREVLEEAGIPGATIEACCAR